MENTIFALESEKLDKESWKDESCTLRSGIPSSIRINFFMKLSQIGDVFKRFKNKQIFCLNVKVMKTNM